MKTPKPEDLELAAEWLGYYEGDGEDLQLKVSAWLKFKAQQLRLRRTAKRLSLPPNVLQEAVKRGSVQHGVTEEHLLESIELHTREEKT